MNFGSPSLLLLLVGLLPVVAALLWLALWRRGAVRRLVSGSPARVSRVRRVLKATLVLAALALALRFVPYSDDHGNFDPVWTAVIFACLLAAAAASVYLVVTLEILKLRATRFRQLFGARGRPPDEAEVDAGVARELETGTFEAVDPQTGEWAAVDPETGEFDAVRPPDERA